MPEGDHEILAAGHFRLVIRVVKKKQFWDKQLLFHFLNLYVKKTLAKAVACIMIFNTALRWQIYPQIARIGYFHVQELGYS